MQVGDVPERDECSDSEIVAASARTPALTGALSDVSDRSPRHEMVVRRLGETGATT